MLVRPLVFPEFARRFLNFSVGIDLAAEESSSSGIPDFTPADLLTHPFVFECKGSDEGIALAGHNEQLLNYLRHGRIEQTKSPCQTPELLVVETMSCVSSWPTLALRWSKSW